MLLSRLGLQGKLVLLTYDGYDALAWLSNSTQSIFLDEQWQATVDVIWRCLKSGLVDFGYEPEEGKDVFNEKYIKELAKNNPDGVPDTIWFQELCLTNLGEELVAKYDMLNRDYHEEIYPPFMFEVEKLFDENGVSLDKGILIPIQKNIKNSIA